MAVCPPTNALVTAFDRLQATRLPLDPNAHWVSGEHVDPADKAVVAIVHGLLPDVMNALQKTGGIEQMRVDAAMPEPRVASPHLTTNRGSVTLKLRLDPVSGKEMKLLAENVSRAAALLVKTALEVLGPTRANTNRSVAIVQHDNSVIADHKDQASASLKLNVMRNASLHACTSCQTGAKSGFEMRFDVGSQHLGCGGPKRPPRTLGAGAKTRLESRMTKFTARCICSAQTLEPTATSHCGRQHPVPQDTRAFPDGGGVDETGGRRISGVNRIKTLQCVLRGRLHEGVPVLQQVRQMQKVKRVHCTEPATGRKNKIRFFFCVTKFFFSCLVDMHA